MEFDSPSARRSVGDGRYLFTLRRRSHRLLPASRSGCSPQIHLSSSRWPVASARRCRGKRFSSARFVLAFCARADRLPMGKQVHSGAQGFASSNGKHPSGTPATRRWVDQRTNVRRILSCLWTKRVNPSGTLHCKDEAAYRICDLDRASVFGIR